MMTADPVPGVKVGPDLASPPSEPRRQQGGYSEGGLMSRRCIMLLWTALLMIGVVAVACSDTERTERLVRSGSNPSLTHPSNPSPQQPAPEAAAPTAVVSMSIAAVGGSLGAADSKKKTKKPRMTIENVGATPVHNWASHGADAFRGATDLQTQTDLCDLTCKSAPPAVRDRCHDEAIIDGRYRYSTWPGGQ